MTFPYSDWRSGGGIIVNHRVGPERGGADLPDRSPGEPALSQLLRREPSVGDGVRHGRLRTEQQGEPFSTINQFIRNDPNIGHLLYSG